MSEPLNTVTAFFKVLNAVCETSCPCCYPRMLDVMTFDSEKEGMGARDLEVTQGFITNFYSRGILSAPFGNCECTKCGTRYKIRNVEYSININYRVCELIELKATPIGREVTSLIPLVGYAKSLRNAPGSEQFNERFGNANSNPNEFVEYMLATIE